METEKENAEETKNQKAAAEQPEWTKGQMGQILSLLNQPGIASALASVGLYFAIDPKAIKKSMEEVQQSNLKLLEMMNDLIEEQVKIKKQLKKLTSQQDETEPRDAEMDGYRKAHKGTGSVYLD